MITEILYYKLFNFIFKDIKLEDIVSNKEEQFKIMIANIESTSLIKSLNYFIKKCNNQLYKRTIILSFETNSKKLYYLRKKLINYDNIFIDNKNIHQSFLNFHNDFDLIIAPFIFENKSNKEWILSNIYDALNLKSLAIFIEKKSKEDIRNYLLKYNFKNIQQEKYLNYVIIKAYKKI